MSKPKIPVELKVILEELCIAPADEATLLRKVHTRAALQAKDYLSIVVSKLELNKHAKTPREYGDWFSEAERSDGMSKYIFSSFGIRGLSSLHFFKNRFAVMTI